ncbi:NUDIX hydrolase [Rhodovulum sp. YNF3179]|uniref:NUDIX hydrolase n=1 Tax=Rhodovulum sp. YNF3179 TaxID=3425127 RepID=UPI003D33546C
MVTLPRTPQFPVRTGGARKDEVRTQFAALCYRVRKGATEVLLITSRDTGRWVLPKGWPMDGVTPADAAAREAWEEAGVTGQVRHAVAGLYSYNKAMESDDDLPCIVAIFPLQVRKLARDFPERGLRKRKWFSPRKAAGKVREPELQEILSRFDASRLGK